MDRIAIEESGLNLYQMMENAGRNLALTVLETLGQEWSVTPIVVLAGTGGNGGGGLCAARHLANRGADVTVVLPDPARLAPVPRHQLAAFRGTPGRSISIDEIHGLEPGIVVDAIIGYGLQGAPHGLAEQMIDWIATQAVPVVSLDVPSGIDTTTGNAPGINVRALSTLALALPKTGLDVRAAGEVLLGDVGIPREVFRRVGIDVPAELFGTSFRVPVRPYRERRN